MRRHSDGWARWAVIAILVTSVAGCALFGGPSREELSADSRNAAQHIRDAYFFDWPAAVEMGRKELDRYPDGAPLIQFVVGEALYLAGKQDEAFPHLLAAVEGEDSLVALAALHLVRDLYVSRPVALDLAAVRPRCDTMLCRGTIASESLEWARAAMRSWDRRRIERNVFWPREWRLFRAGGSDAFRDLEELSPEEEEYRRGNSFAPPSSARRIEMPDTVSAFDLRNHFSPVRNSVFFAFAVMTVTQEEPVVVLPYITVPYRLYIDGAVVLERDADRLTAGVLSGAASIRLSKGSHTILLKLAPYLSDEGYVSLHFYRDDTPFLQAGADIAEPRDTDSRMEAYLRLLARDLLFGDVRLGDWEEWYASADGSRAPAPLLWTARAYRREGNGQGAASLLSFLAKEWPDLVLVKGDLLENCQDIGDDTCVREVMSAEGGDRKELVWLLRLSDVYYAKKWYAKDLGIAERLVKEYDRHPVSYYYLSDAWRGLGDPARAARIRHRAVALIPAYQPTWSRLAELYRETGDLPALIRTARRLLEIDPYNLEYRRTLGEAYLADESWGKAEREFRAALAQNPESAAIWARLGDVLALDGRVGEAVAAFRRAYDLAPEEGEYAERLDAFDAGDQGFFAANALDTAAIDGKIAAFRRAAAEYPQKYTIVYDEGLRQVYYNGSSRSRFRLVISLNTAEGVREFATVANYGRVLSARVVKPDGRSLPSWRADAETLYFLDTGPGDVIDFTIESLEGPRSWLGGTDFRWFFATEGVFNLHSRLVLRFPADAPVTFFVRGPVTRAERKAGDAKEISFETTGLHQPSAEPGMPPLTDVLPTVSYTTVPSWGDFARWQALFVREQQEESGAIRRFTESLIAPANEPLARIRILRDWVARQVRYLFDDRGIAKIRPGPVEKTFVEKAGDCKDKALLLKVMLHYAGIEARYALAKSASSGMFLSDLPSMQFDHALVFVPPQEGIAEGFFLDATAAYDHFRGVNPFLVGTTAFVVDETQSAYRFETVSGPVESAVSLAVGAENRVRIRLSGGAASTARYRFAADGDPFAYFGELVTRVAGKPVSVTQCTLLNGQYDEPLEAECTVVPFVPALVSAILGKLAEPQERKYPLLLSDRILHWEISVRGLSASFQPISVDNDFFQWRVVNEGDAFTTMLRLKTITIPTERYGLFREAVGESITAENRMRGMMP